ncbi:hypothetical protein ACJX0J_010468, partial [Zea mays]
TLSYMTQLDIFLVSYVGFYMFSNSFKVGQSIIHKLWTRILGLGPALRDGPIVWRLQSVVALESVLKKVPDTFFGHASTLEWLVTCMKNDYDKSSQTSGLMMTMKDFIMGHAYCSHFAQFTIALNYLFTLPFAFFSNRKWLSFFVEYDLPVNLNLAVILKFTPFLIILHLFCFKKKKECAIAGDGYDDQGQCLSRNNFMPKPNVNMSPSVLLVSLGFSLLLVTVAGSWMARLNEGLSLFDAILIVPMFQITWTFFSICIGFVYFQEYQVFDTLRIIMFVLGMTFVFVGISLLAPDDSKADTKDGSSTAEDSIIDIDRNGKMLMEETDIDDSISFVTSVKVNAKRVLSKAKLLATANAANSAQGIVATLLEEYEGIFHIVIKNWMMTMSLIGSVANFHYYLAAPPKESREPDYCIGEQNGNIMIDEKTNFSFVKKHILVYRIGLHLIFLIESGGNLIQNLFR